MRSKLKDRMHVKSIVFTATLVALSTGVCAQHLPISAARAQLAPLPISAVPAQQDTVSPVVLAVPIAAPTNPLAIPVPIEQVWSLEAGQTIRQNLAAWAKKASWHVIWELSKDWVVPAPAQFRGDFPTAVEQVVTTLAKNGALIRAHISEGNNTIVIYGLGAGPAQK